LTRSPITAEPTSIRRVRLKTWWAIWVMSALRPTSPCQCGITGLGCFFCVSDERCDSAIQAQPNPSVSAASTWSKKLRNICASDGARPSTGVWLIEKKMSNCTARGFSPIVAAWNIIRRPWYEKGVKR
jgi:hypothetical protein